MKKPNPRDYGWIDASSPEERGGWTIEGGQTAYMDAVQKYQDGQFPAMIKDQADHIFTAFFDVDKINHLISHGRQRRKDGFGNFQEGQINDGFHTFDELYEFRLVYNALAFNLLDQLHAHYGSKTEVYKSKRHYNGEECFGGGWFIVIAMLPTGQVSNHYKMEHWDLFSCEELVNAPWEWDGHTAQDVVKRIKEFLKS